MEEEEENEVEELLYKNVDFVLAVIKTTPAGNYLPLQQRPSYLKKTCATYASKLLEETTPARCNKVLRYTDGRGAGMWILWPPQIQTLFVCRRKGTTQTSRKGG